jgi:enamine deaminase RidA (YjgF/YER057c/UK114 family)
LKNILSPNNSGKSIFDLQTANLQERIKDAQDVLDGTTGNADDEKLSEEAAFENLQEATNSIMESLKTVIDYYDSLLDNIEEASSKMDDLIDSRLEEFDNLEEFLETRLDQVTLLLGEKSYEQQALLYNQKIETNLEKMTSINAAIEAKQVTVKALEKLEATNKELSTEERQTLTDARDELAKLQKEQLNTETKLLQDINNKLKAQTANEMNDLLSQLFGGADVD